MRTITRTHRLAGTKGAFVFLEYKKKKTSYSTEIKRTTSKLDRCTYTYAYAAILCMCIYIYNTYIHTYIRDALRTHNDRLDTRRGEVRWGTVVHVLTSLSGYVYTWLDKLYACVCVRARGDTTLPISFTQSKRNRSFEKCLGIVGMPPTITRYPRLGDKGEMRQKRWQTRR